MKMIMLIVAICAGVATLIFGILWYMSVNNASNTEDQEEKDKHDSRKRTMMILTIVSSITLIISGGTTIYLYNK